MIAKMRNMGEACTSANRFLVQNGVAREFTEKLAVRMGDLTVGRGQDDGVDVGPLIDAEAVAGVTELVEAAVAQGATQIGKATGRERVCTYVSISVAAVSLKTK